MKNLMVALLVLVAVAAKPQNVEPSVETTRYVHQNGVLDASGKIRACIAELPPTGGVCDASTLTGKQSLGSTVTIPKNVTLRLGNAEFTATSAPAIILSDNSKLIGAGWRDKPGFGTHIVSANTAGSAAIRLASYGNGTQKPGGSAVRIDISELSIEGTSTKDGSTGLDLQGMQLGNISRVRVQNFQTGIRIGWGAFQWNCDCYNRFDDVQVIRTAIGVDLQRSTNKLTWIGGNVQPFVEGAIGFKMFGYNNVLISPDVENFAHGGIAFDLLGSANQILSPYIEAGTTAIQVEASAHYNQVIGGTSSSLGSPSLNWIKGADTETNTIYQLQNLSMWPVTSGVGSTLEFGQGSTANYYLLSTAPGGAYNGIGLSYNSNSAAKTVYGATGPAPFKPGYVGSQGGISSKGRVSVTALPNPAAPVVTAGGLSGTTTYQYRVVCRDYNRGLSMASPIAEIKTGSSVLDSKNPNLITWNCGDGYLGADVLKYDGAHWRKLSPAGNSVGAISAIPFKDVGQVTTEYTLPAHNTTGELSVDTGSPNKVVCYKADGKTLGYCTDAPTANGCTCSE